MPRNSPVSRHTYFLCRGSCCGFMQRFPKLTEGGCRLHCRRQNGSRAIRRIALPFCTASLSIAAILREAALRLVDAVVLGEVFLFCADAHRMRRDPRVFQTVNHQRDADPRGGLHQIGNRRTDGEAAHASQHQRRDEQRDPAFHPEAACVKAHLQL